MWGNLTYLRARACQVGTEHDRPWSLVRELLSGSLEAIFKQLEVATTAIATLLVLDLILNNQRFVAEVDGLCKRRGDGVVGRLGLGDESLVALDENGLRVLYLPLADIAEGLATDRGLLGGF